MLIQLYRHPEPQSEHTSDFEECFYIELERTATVEELAQLTWLVSSPSYVIAKTPQYADDKVVEIGPRLSVETPCPRTQSPYVRPWVCRCGGWKHRGRYLLAAKSREDIINRHLDRMTQQVYPKGTSRNAIICQMTCQISWYNRRGV